MPLEKSAPPAITPNDSRPCESEEVRAKVLEPKDRILAAGERIARDHADILRALAR